jgi:hypothetical protein
MGITDEEAIRWCRFPLNQAWWSLPQKSSPLTRKIHFTAEIAENAEEKCRENGRLVKAPYDSQNILISSITRCLCVTSAISAGSAVNKPG